MPRGIPKKKDVIASDNTIQEREDMKLEETAVEPVRKKGTKPGWKPAGQLPRLKGPSGYSVKWASSDTGKLAKLRAEGWIIMKPSDNKGDPIEHVDVNDGNALGKEIRYRDLVAVMLPQELKEARDEWVREENRNAMKNILQKTDEKFKEHGVQTYAPTGQSGRIVIE